MFLTLKSTDWKEEDYVKNNIVPFGWCEDNNRAIPSVEIKRSTELKIKLSKKQKEELRQMRKYRRGSISLEIEDPLKEFKAKLKEQIRLNNR